MARPGLVKHPKFLRLAHQLGIPKPHALGLLEYLWEVGYECGDPLIGDATSVELAAGWDGEPGVLCQALLGCGVDGQAGFIDEVDGKEGTFEIHDLYDHAPNYVQRRMKREAERKACGKTISDLRREAGIKSGEARKRTKGNKRETVVHEQTGTSDEQTATNGATPAPAPAPAPKKELPTEVLEKDGQEDSPKPDDFIRLWASTSRHHGIAAVRKWTPDRRAKLRTRLAQNGWWGAFQEAAKKLPLPGDGWQPDADWFLANDQNVYKILEGKYDWRATKSGGGRPDPAAAHDPDRPCEAL